MVVEAIDVSSHQPTVDWQAVAKAGIRAVWVKATEGVSYRSPTYAAQVAGARKAGLTVGAYHFLRPSVPGRAQAEAFLEQAQPRSGDLVPMLDVEALDGVTVPRIHRAMVAFLRAVDRAVGRLCGVYVSPSFADRIRLGEMPGLARRPLWVADWWVPEPAVPAPWREWTVWQYDSLGQVPGIPGRVDRDRVRGGVDALQGLRIP